MEAKSRRPGRSRSRVVDPASGPREPTDLDPTTQSRTDPVDIFFAGEPDNKRAIRRSINRLNAASAVRSARSACGDAQALFWTAAQLAGMWCYRPCTEESLRSAFKALCHMYQAANVLDWLETPNGD